MIDSALNVLASELNNFIKIKFLINDDIVVLSNLVNSNGDPLYKDENKLVLSLINIQEEKQIQKAGGSHKNAPIYINLFIMLTSSFNEKLMNESLKFLSAAIGFFQSKRIFTESVP